MSNAVSLCLRNIALGGNILIWGYIDEESPCLHDILMEDNHSLQGEQRWKVETSAMVNEYFAGTFLSVSEKFHFYSDRNYFLLHNTYMQYSYILFSWP